MVEKRLYHIATGGTIDSIWDGSKDTAVTNAASSVPHYLSQVARIGQIESATPFMLDSRQMGIPEQDKIADHIAEVAHNRVIVTIGTYLMPDVAKVISHHPMAKHFADLDRRIVLTGAAKPLAGYLRSDAGFNLGMGVAILDTDISAISTRISVVMSGGCFDPHDIRKDLTSARFSGFERYDKLPYQDLDLVTVGGSIDFVPDGFDGMKPAENSTIPSYLRDDVKIGRKIYAVNPFLKDSRNLGQKEFDTAVKMVAHSKTDKVIVTTGLYKIKELALKIRDQLGQGSDKIVILTGSRVPLGVTDMTDAPFNLGYTFGKLGFLKPGVYISLNGKIMTAEDDIFSHVYTSDEIAHLKSIKVIHNGKRTKNFAL